MRSEKRADRLAESWAILDVRQMADAGQDDQSGIGKSFGQLAGDRGWVDQVQLADQDEGRRPDRSQPIPGVVLNRRAGLTLEGIGLLRPLVPLGESD